MLDDPRVARSLSWASVVDWPGAARGCRDTGSMKIRNPYRAIYEHFRLRRGLEWLTAEALRERYGGSLDYVKKVADYCVFKKMTAVKRERPHVREYRPSFFKSLNGKVVDRSGPKV
jgi:hypothetical protein